MIGGCRLRPRPAAPATGRPAAIRRRGSGPTRGTLVCATELEAACATIAQRHPELTVRTEEAQVTLTSLARRRANPASVGFDAWLVPQPWPDMANQQRQQRGSGAVLGDPTGVLARSPLVIAIWNDRRDALAQRCGATITWKCIGEVAGTAWGADAPQSAWGAVKPGHPTPERTAAGLLTLGEASASWFGTADFASNDFASPEFRAWFTRLERSIPSFPVPPRTPLDDMLFTGPASFDLTGSTEAAAGPAISASRDSGRLTILYPAPLTTADVVMAPVAGSDAGDRMKKLIESDQTAEVLAASGWRVDGQPAAPGLPDDARPARRVQRPPGRACSRPSARCGSRSCDDPPPRGSGPGRGRGDRHRAGRVLHLAVVVELGQRRGCGQPRATAWSSTCRCRARRSTCSRRWPRRSTRPRRRSTAPACS